MSDLKFPEWTAVIREVNKGEFIIVSFKEVRVPKDVAFVPTHLRSKQKLQLKP